jgi:hypothetical protein
LNRTVLNQKNVPHKTGRGNSGHHEKALHNSGGWQSQHTDLAKKSLEQVRGQKTDEADGATSTSAQLFGETGKSDATRVFHGIYATTTTCKH